LYGERVEPTVELLWIPLGAGGSGVVRFNGRVYERWVAFRQRRPALDLFHTALRVTAPSGTYIVETMWPSPSGPSGARGVAVRGPVWWKRLGRFRLFRYEVRCWRDGLLPDADEAVGGPRVVSTDPAVAARILVLASRVPPLTWGVDPDGTGEMWNSNSVISWLLDRAGIDGVETPAGGRAPGWEAGIAVSRLGWMAE
jgi:hypothetical protein